MALTQRADAIILSGASLEPAHHSIFRPCPRIWAKQYTGGKAVPSNPAVECCPIVNDPAFHEIRVTEISHSYLVAVCRNARRCYEVSFGWYTSKGKLNLWKLSPLFRAIFSRAISRSLMAWRACNSASQGAQPIASNSSQKNPGTICSRAVRQSRSAGDRKNEKASRWPHTGYAEMCCGVMRRVLEEQMLEASREEPNISFPR